jgi:hypothetical protein
MQIDFEFLSAIASLIIATLAKTFQQENLIDLWFLDQGPQITI